MQKVSKKSLNLWNPFSINICNNYGRTVVYLENMIFCKKSYEYLVFINMGRSGGANFSLNRLKLTVHIFLFLRNDFFKKISTGKGPFLALIF